MRIHRNLAIIDATSAAVNVDGTIADSLEAAHSVLQDHGFGGDLDALDVAMEAGFPNYKDAILEEVLIRN